jgi:excisionase family DNA binding protein
MNTFYTLPEVAQLLKVSVSTVRRMVRSGSIKSTRVGAQRQIRISEAALEALMNVDSESGSMVNRPKHAEIESRANGHSPVESRVNIIDGVTPRGHRWSVLNADVEVALRTLPESSVNCVVTSPPYYWQRDYEVEGQIGHEPTIQGYVDAITGVMRVLRPALTANGTVFLNLGDTYYSAKGKPHGKDGKHNGRQMMRRHLRAVDGPGLGLPRKSLIGIPWRVALAMQDDGWTLRTAIIWHRPATLPEPTAHDRPWRTYENIFVFSKGPRYWFNREGLGKEEDVWRINARPENPGSHFAPYSKELVHRCLACGCPAKGTVLDPFVGSGTTMVAALERGLNTVGIEIKKQYADFAIGRIRREFESKSG